MLKSTTMIYNNTDNTPILKHIIDLNNALVNRDIPMSQLSHIAQQQLHLIKEYTAQIRNRIQKNINDKIRLHYRVSTKVRMDDTIKLGNTDKYRYKRYFRTKMKDFVSNLNIYYIEIKHKFHKLFRRIKSKIRRINS